MPLYSILHSGMSVYMFNLISRKEMIFSQFKLASAKLEFLQPPTTKCSEYVKCGFMIYCLTPPGPLCTLCVSHLLWIHLPIFLRPENNDMCPSELSLSTPKGENGPPKTTLKWIFKAWFYDIFFDNPWPTVHITRFTFNVNSPPNFRQGEIFFAPWKQCTWGFY